MINSAVTNIIYFKALLGEALTAVCTLVQRCRGMKSLQLREPFVEILKRILIGRNDLGIINRLCMADKQTAAEVRIEGSRNLKVLLLKDGFAKGVHLRLCFLIF